MADEPVVHPIPAPLDHDLLVKALDELAQRIAVLQGTLASHAAYVAGVAQTAPRR